MSDASDWDAASVVARGLPDAPPPPLRHGDEVPVAVWRGDGIAAVLSIGFDDAHAHDEDECPYSQYIDVVVSTADGWTSTGAAGSDWRVAYGERPSEGPPSFTGFAAGYRAAGDEQRWLRSGIAPVGVTRVRVVFPTEEHVVDAEPMSGAFLVAAPDPQTRAELVSWPGPPRRGPTGRGPARRP
jgi:hypothetical protein